jgi:uncharacterized membrane protein YraQ (UPF0718 family)
LLPGGWFLLVVGLSYGAAFALAPDAALSALARLGPLLGGMLPALGVVFALLFLGELFLEPELVERHLGPDAGMRGWGLAIAGGVLSMGPMVAWLPLLAALRRRGTAPGLIAAFLYGRAVKLPLLPVMVHYFGLRYTALLVGALLAGAVVNGALTGRLAGALPHNTASDARGRG